MPELLSELLHELNCRHSPKNHPTLLGPTETNEHLVREPGLLMVVQGGVIEQGGE
jgi:hypothetical protein